MIQCREHSQEQHSEKQNINRGKEHLQAAGEYNTSFPIRHGVQQLVLLLRLLWDVCSA